MSSRTPYYGKYRGVVTDNVDPLMQGRIKARVADVYGEDESGWALPAAPYAGDGVGFFALPPVDALVWIEFEKGDPDYPIWSGCFWAQGQVPLPTDALATPQQVKVFKTDNGTITLDDRPGTGGITIETSDGRKVELTSTGIAIDAGAGTITINGTQVSVNNGALEVM